MGDILKYKDAIKQSMRMLAKDKRTIFIGYNVNFGSRVYGTLTDIPKSKCLETPLAENLMTGIAIGMSLEGFKPVLIFERHDFILNALDQIVNHLDKMEKMSDGQFKPKVIIRAIVGAKKPLYPGLQHTQNYTKALKMMVSFPIIELKRTNEIIQFYRMAKRIKKPIMLVEYRDLYDRE